MHYYWCIIIINICCIDLCHSISGLLSPVQRAQGGLQTIICCWHYCYFATSLHRRTFPCENLSALHSGSAPWMQAMNQILIEDCSPSPSPIHQLCLTWFTEDSFAICPQPLPSTRLFVFLWHLDQHWPCLFPSYYLKGEIIFSFAWEKDRVQAKYLTFQ